MNLQAWIWLFSSIWVKNRQGRQQSKCLQKLFKKIWKSVLSRYTFLPCFSSQLFIDWTTGAPSASIQSKGGKKGKKSIFESLSGKTFNWQKRSLNVFLYRSISWRLSKRSELITLFCLRHLFISQTRWATSQQEAACRAFKNNLSPASSQGGSGNFGNTQLYCFIHTSYLSFFLHRQKFWTENFTPKNA